LGHLDGALAALSASDAGPDTVAELLREAGDRYIEANAPQMTQCARRQLKPVSEAAIRALAAVLAGPGQAVYEIASSSGTSTYRLEVAGADIACDCKGFSYRGMCRHARDLKDALATGAPVPERYRPIAP
jgi:hypothetical protein